MSEKLPPSTLRLLVGVMLGGSITLIGIAVWQISRHEGAPVFTAVAGSMLAALSAVVASQSKKKP